MKKNTTAPASVQSAVAYAHAANSIPAEIRELLGPGPLIRWESTERYERVLTRMAQAVDPKDWIEWVWTKDLVDLGWEAARARRAQATAVALAYQKAIAHLMGGNRENLTKSGAMEIQHQLRIARLTAGDKDEYRALQEMLKGKGLSNEAIGDTAYLLAMNDTERLGLVITRCETRRDAILREMDRRREFNARMRAALRDLDQAVDAEFDDLEGAD